jgi:hypothetical protein
VVVADTAFAAPGHRIDLPGLDYFVVRSGVLFAVYGENRRIERVEAASGRPIGDPVAGVGADVGRARFAAGALWMTNPRTAPCRRSPPCTSYRRRSFNVTALRRIASFASRTRLRGPSCRSNFA